MNPKWQIGLFVLNAQNQLKFPVILLNSCFGIAYLAAKHICLVQYRSMH